jgi:hypothetical protein
MEKIKLELDAKYGEYIQLIKELILTEDGQEITDDNKAVEVLLESFVTFLQEQANHEHDHHNHEHEHDHHHHDH